MVARRLGREVDIVEVAKGGDHLAKVQLGEPDGRTRAPQPNDAPGPHVGEGRGRPAHDARDERQHGGEEGRVLAPDHHADAGREAVDAVKVHEIGDEGEAPGENRDREQHQDRREVQARHRHARHRRRRLRRVVRQARVAGLGLAALQEQLLREDAHARRARDQADGDGDQEGELRHGEEVGRDREHVEGRVVEPDEVDSLFGAHGNAEQEAGDRRESHLGPEGCLGSVLL